LLSAIVVAVNVAVYILISYRNIPRFWLPPAVIGMLIVILAAIGVSRINHLETPQPGIGVAAIQFSKGDYNIGDYTKFGMDKYYLRFVQQAWAGIPAPSIFGCISPERSRQDKKALVSEGFSCVLRR